jgi:hypothetical protein
MSSVFWDVTLYFSIEFANVSEVRIAFIEEYGSLLFGPEDESNKFLRKASELCRTIQSFIPRERGFSV